MNETKKIKKLLKSRLQEYFGRRWAYKLAERSGYSDDHIRKYFRSEINNPAISEIAAKLIEEAKRNEQETLNQIRS